MTLETVVSATINWVWNEYGKALADKAVDDLKQKWHQFQWADAEAKYVARLKNQHSTTRLLGHPKPITIEHIFTDVYVLDKPTAFWRFDLNELQARAFEREELTLDYERKPALRLAANEKRLFF